MTVTQSERLRRVAEGKMLQTTYNEQLAKLAATINEDLEHETLD